MGDAGYPGRLEAVKAKVGASQGASLLSVDSRVAPAMADTNRRWAEGMLLRCCLEKGG